MIVGTTIFRLDGNPYYSPEFPRGGLGALFIVDVMNLNLTASESLTITVEHRNSEDTSWTTLGTFAAITAVAPHSLDVTAIKEIVRLRFAFTSTTVFDGAHFLVQAPSWRPYA